MTELIWNGKYDSNGKKTAPVRLALPFQDIETVNESAQTRTLQLDLWSSGQPREWRNRLIWGDKKYVLPSLLPEFAGTVDLIYIDPPFNTGSDFSFTATIPDDPATPGDQSATFTKAPSMIEQKAYRDTWGRGLDGYLQWFYETAALLHELLAENGSVFVHLDNNIGHYAKIIMDEVFGNDNFRNEIIVKRRITKNLQRQFDTIQALSLAHDTILWYSRSAQSRFKPLFVPMETKSAEGYWHHFWSNADRPTMRYDLLGVTPSNGQWKWSKDRALRAVENYNEYIKQSNGGTLVQYWNDTGRRLEFIRLSAKGKVENWFPPSTERIGDTIWLDIHAYENEKDYATQKHEELLERVIKHTTDEGDLVLDCFCGSGTTAAVAEKLGRRWITCDLGRFAIHTTRKRLLNIPNVTPFVVQNLGKYERQAWQAAEFGHDSARAALLQQRYRRFILDLYHAEPIDGYTWLHGVKAGRFVHVGSVDAPIVQSDLQAIAREFWQAVGKGAGATINTVDILGWDFAFETNEVGKQLLADANIKAAFKKIPREVLERRAVEQGDITFFELAALDVEIKNHRGTEDTENLNSASVISVSSVVQIELRDFVVHPDDVPQDVMGKITHWSQWIDYWAIDWNFKGDTFHNEWQAYRTRQSQSLQTSVSHRYDLPGTYTIVVKVIDILGNDTTKSLTVEI